VPGTKLLLKLLPSSDSEKPSSDSEAVSDASSIVVVTAAPAWSATTSVFTSSTSSVSGLSITHCLTG